MNDLNIYLSNEIENHIYKQLVSLGYSVVTGSSNYENLLENGVSLVVMGTNKENYAIAERLKKQLTIDLLLLDTHNSEAMNAQEIGKLQPIALLTIPMTDNEIKINMECIYNQISSNKQIDNKDIWLKGVLNTTLDAVIAIDTLGFIKFMNPTAQRLIGVEENVANGMLASRVIQFKSNTQYKFLQSNSDSESSTFEDEIYNRITKTYISISANISSLKDKNCIYVGKVLTLKDVRQIKSLFNRMSYQESHDNLTGILNRKSFINKVDELITLSQYDNSTHGLIIISLDKFKVVNDSCGHLAGDELLRKISYIIKEITSEKNFIIGRISGDEFGVLLKNNTLTKVKQLASSLKRTISSHDFIWGDKEFPIRCSYGIVTINKLTEDHNTLLAAGNDACAISKEKGGGRIEIYDKIDKEYNNRRNEMLWIHRLKEAITNDLFLLYYQDIESVKGDEIKKIEILVRLKDDEGNILSPVDFIPPAEQYGIMPEIDRIIIEKSVEFCKNIIEDKKIKETYIISVNLSAASLFDKSLPSYIQTTFQKYKVPPTLFCFEITETTTIKNMTAAQSFIKSLKRIGCTFSLDDFGSGFSNYTYLRKLDIDYLKIDGSFISDILDDPINKEIVESINSIGHIMKLKTVAEFVENEKIKDLLVKIGVDYVQGYTISKPTPIEYLLL